MRWNANIRHGQINKSFAFFMKFLLIREIIGGMEILYFIEGFCLLYALRT
jgi:hypothetical protein